MSPFLKGNNLIICFLTWTVKSHVSLKQATPVPLSLCFSHRGHLLPTSRLQLVDEIPRGSKNINCHFCLFVQCLKTQEGSSSWGLTSVSPEQPYVGEETGWMACLWLAPLGLCTWGLVLGASFWGSNVLGNGANRRIGKYLSCGPEEEGVWLFPD